MGCEDMLSMHYQSMISYTHKLVLNCLISGTIRFAVLVYVEWGNDFARKRLSSLNDLRKIVYGIVPTSVAKKVVW